MTISTATSVTNESTSAGITEPDTDGKITAITPAASQQFSSGTRGRNAAIRWLAARGYAPDGSRLTGVGTDAAPPAPPTRAAFLAKYRELLTVQHGEGWEGMPKLMASVMVTVSTARATWDHKGEIAREAFRAIGCKGPVTLKALRALPAEDAETAAPPAPELVPDTSDVCLAIVLLDQPGDGGPATILKSPATFQDWQATKPSDGSERDPRMLLRSNAHRLPEGARVNVAPQAAGATPITEHQLATGADELEGSGVLEAAALAAAADGDELNHACAGAALLAAQPPPGTTVTRVSDHLLWVTVGDPPAAAPAPEQPDVDGSRPAAIPLLPDVPDPGPEAVAAELERVRAELAQQPEGAAIAAAGVDVLLATSNARVRAQAAALAEQIAPRPATQAAAIDLVSFSRRGEDGQMCALVALRDAPAPATRADVDEQRATLERALMERDAAWRLYAWLVADPEAHELLARRRGDIEAALGPVFVEPPAPAHAADQSAA